MLKKIKNLNRIATILLILQAVSYIGAVTEQSEPITNKAELYGYYFGYNICLLIAIILYLYAWSLKRKLQTNNEEDIVGSIGRE